MPCFLPCFHEPPYLYNRMGGDPQRAPFHPCSNRDPQPAPHTGVHPSTRAATGTLTLRPMP
eukprot:7378999-Prymnesium_polylepis.2